MQNLISNINLITEKIGKLISWLSLLLVLVICYDVVMRYVFDTSTAALFELEWHIFAALFILSIAYALKHDKHVRVDVFYQRFSRKTQSIINLVGTLIFLIPWCYLVITTSYKFAINSWYIREGSSQPGGLPARYVIKGMIVIGFILLALQGFSLIVKHLKELKTGSWKS